MEKYSFHDLFHSNSFQQKNLKTKSYKTEQILWIKVIWYLLSIHLSKIHKQSTFLSQTFHCICLFEKHLLLFGRCAHQLPHYMFTQLPNLLLFVPRRIHKQHILPSRLTLISCAQKHVQISSLKFRSFLIMRK